MATGGLTALSWTSSTDDTGVVAYRIYRDGTLTTTVGEVTGWSDTGLEPGTTHSYEITALDASGNESPRSQRISVSMPTGEATVLFADGFEAGDFDRWSAYTGMTVGTAERFAGLRAARATSAGPPSNAYIHLPSDEPQIAVDLRFK